METKELKINNLVTVDNPKHHPTVKDSPLMVVEVQNWRAEPTVSLMHIEPKENFIIPSYSQLAKFIKPIPLTEEWLLKFGFSRVFHQLSGEHKHLPSHYNLNGFVINVTYYAGCDDICHFEFDRYPSAELKYIHQLQNLVFALTGEELESKEVVS